MKRKCKCCKKLKPDSGFCKAAHMKEGIHTTCKTCRNMINVLQRLQRKAKSKIKPGVILAYEFKQFLFFLTFPENKQKVYAEIRSGLGFSEQMQLFRISRVNDNEWREAA